jgi:hypothetical protein
LSFHIAGKKLSDGKGLQGIGRFSLKRINSCQNFYGKAIRDNKGDVDAMCRQTMAILKHYSDLPREERHGDCPPGINSWCKHQQDLAREDGVTTYKDTKHPFAPAVYEVLLPMFTALSNKKLLEGCVQCLTQNANESLHHCIWNLVPKDTYHSPMEISLGINLAVSIFNDGQLSTMTAVMEHEYVTVSQQSIQTWASMDKKRILDGNRVVQPEVKLQRKEKRKAKLSALDAFTHAEGTMYGSGQFFGSVRKTPNCKTCGKPRKGHKRGPCTEKDTHL